MVAKPNMILDVVRNLRLADPFRQFYVVLKDGRRLFVDQPYHLGIAADGSHLMVCPGGSDPQHLLPDDVQDVDVRSDSGH